jgi:hypothetical protein
MRALRVFKFFRGNFLIWKPILWIHRKNNNFDMGGYVQLFEEFNQKMSAGGDHQSKKQLGKILSHLVMMNDKNIDRIRELIDAGADLDVRTSNDVDNYLPLHWAAFWGNIDTMKLLIDAGVNLDGGTKLIDDDTALHVAVRERKPEAVKLLIDAGADIDRINDRGLTALDVAIEFGFQEIIKLLVLGGVDLKAEFGTFKEFNDSFGGDIKWIPPDLIPPEWRESAKFTGTFGGFY